MNNKNRGEDSAARSRTWPFFVLIFISIAAILTSISFGIIAYAQSVAREQLVSGLQATERQAVNAMRREAEATLFEVTSDLLAMRRIAARMLINEGDAAGLTNTMRDFLNNHRGYDQLRIIGSAGREQIRVDNEPKGATPIPQAQLQDKSQSRYMRLAQKLGPDEILVSQLDVNRERGAIEMPLKPVIRVLARLPDDRFIVLNFLARSLMESMESVGSAAYGEPLVISRLGVEALAALRAGTEDALRATQAAPDFTQRFPHAWRAMNAVDSDAVDDGEGGVMVFTRFYPADLQAPDNFLEKVRWTLPMSASAETEGGWYIASHVDQGSIGAITGLGILRSPTVIALYAVLVLLLSALTAAWLSRQRRRSAKLKVLATRDALTDLMNRGEFEARMNAALAHVERYSRTAALVLIDVDNIREINDRMGNAAGDQLLLHFANILKSSVRSIDLIGRVGGDEFAVLLSEVSHPEDTQAVASKIRKNLDRTVILKGSGVRVSASVGAATYPNNATTVPELFKEANRAMRRSKAENAEGELAAV